MNKQIMNKYYLLRTKYGFLRHFIKDNFNYKIPNHKVDNVYVFGIPTHTNIGDQAIAIATRVFLTKTLPNKNIVEIPDYAVIKVAKYLRKIDKSESLTIIFHGGGNMGDTWPQADVYKHEVYKMVPNATFIQFPQSTSFQPEGHNLSLVVHDLEQTNSTVFARETLSFEFMKKNFRNTNVLFSPDIVLSLNMKNSHLERTYVTTFLRKDVEKQSNESVTFLNDYLIKNIEDLRSSDTVVSDFEGKVTEQNREELFLKKLREFQESKLVVTDRLHGMIFACITGTPAIVFDNSNHKIRYTYQNWLKNVPYIYFVKEGLSLKELEKKIQYFLSNSDEYQVPKFDKEYQSITDLLKDIN